MPDLPGWKVRREIARLGQQLRAIPEAVWEPVANRRHDALVARGLPVREGEVGARDKVLLYLVYQPEGLSDTTFATLRDMIGQGYAPVVVSNAPLSARDAGRIRGFTHLAVERPNFGYDFGGYRDGLTVLRQRGLDPETVVILNDSVWFPVRDGEDVLARLETDPAQFLGLQYFERAPGDERRWAPPPSRCADQPFPQFVAGGKNRIGVVQRDSPGLGQVQRARRALYQPHAKAIFQPGQDAAHGRGRQAKPPPGLVHHVHRIAAPEPSADPGHPGREKAAAAGQRPRGQRVRPSATLRTRSIMRFT